jgi:hypothetical protein
VVRRVDVRDATDAPIVEVAADLAERAVSILYLLSQIAEGGGGDTVISPPEKRKAVRKRRAPYRTQ